MEKVLLVFGGKSYEHDISVVTAAQIYLKTKSDKIELVPLYISRENKMFLYDNKEFDIKEFSLSNFSEKNKNFKEVTFVYSEKHRLFQRGMFGLKECLFVDKAIIACHGGDGENGRVVSMFENMGISCSSGGVDGLSVCMNKFLFKQVMKGIDVPVVSGFKLLKTDYENTEFKRKLYKRIRFMKFPLIIKPNCGGSSIGLFVANGYDDFDEKVKQAFEFDHEIIVEKFVKNAREFNVAVLGTIDDFEISEVDEPVKESDVLSFADKYLSSGKSTKNICGNKNSMASQKRNFPANISEDIRKQIKILAYKIFKNLKLSGVVRIDFLYSESEDKLYVCEVNAVPGSLAFYFFSKNKIVVNDLVERLVKSIENTRTERQEINKEFITNVLD